MASSSQCIPPYLDNLCSERVYCLIVIWYREVIEVAFYYRLDPFPLFRYWVMHSFLEFFFYLCDFVP